MAPKSCGPAMGAVSTDPPVFDLSDRGGFGMPSGLDPGLPGTPPECRTMVISRLYRGFPGILGFGVRYTPVVVYR